MSSTLLGDIKPNATDTEKFILILQELNEYLFDWKLVKVDCVYEIMILFWNTIVREFKRTTIEEIIIQLVDDLKSNFVDLLIDIKNLQYVHNWHN